MKTTCIKAIITGKVQGVFYRDSARKKATALNIRGWVKNNSGGTVELIACGDDENIKTFIAWLWKGPMLAKVLHVDFHEIPIQDFEEFVIYK